MALQSHLSRQHVLNKPVTSGHAIPSNSQAYAKEGLEQGLRKERWGNRLRYGQLAVPEADDDDSWRQLMACACIRRRASSAKTGCLPDAIRENIRPSPTLVPVAVVRLNALTRCCGLAIGRYAATQSRTSPIIP
ncbi:hypothetical protein G7046_g7072 [Stylonectria norvegica]|nr:hypothetical protein G7046_g7072 [Stylonectria norvegica]